MRLTLPHFWERSLRISQQHLHPSGSMDRGSPPFKAGLSLLWNELAGSNMPPAAGREGVKRCPTSATPPSPPSALHNTRDGNQRRGRLCHPSVLHTRVLHTPHPDARAQGWCPGLLVAAVSWGISVSVNAAAVTEHRLGGPKDTRLSLAVWRLSPRSGCWQSLWLVRALADLQAAVFSLWPHAAEGASSRASFSSNDPPIPSWGSALVTSTPPNLAHWGCASHFCTPPDQEPGGLLEAAMNTSRRRDAARPSHPGKLAQRAWPAGGLVKTRILGTDRVLPCEPAQAVCPPQQAARGTAAGPCEAGPASREAFPCPVPGNRAHPAQHTHCLTGHGK